MIINYVPNEQIHSLETDNGHCRRLSGQPVRTATKNDNRLDERPLCRELNSRTSKAAAADFGTHATMLKTM